MVGPLREMIDGAQVDALGPVDQPQVVADEAAVGLGRRDVVHRGVVLVALHEHVDVAVERGREQERLALLGGLVEDALDLGQEAHVGHAVGFVDDDEVDAVEAEVAPVHQVGQATGAGDGDVDAAAQGLQLAVEADAAVEGVDATAALARRGPRGRAPPGRRAHGWGRARAHGGAWGGPARRWPRAARRRRWSCPSPWGPCRRRRGRRGRRGWWRPARGRPGRCRARTARRRGRRGRRGMQRWAQRLRHSKGGETREAARRRGFGPTPWRCTPGERTSACLNPDDRPSGHCTSAGPSNRASRHQPDFWGRLRRDVRRKRPRERDRGWELVSRVGRCAPGCPMWRSS